MKRGIVLKLFLLTSMLCILILATVFIGQTIFFKQFYVNKKVKDLESNITLFEKEYMKNTNDISTIQQLERDFAEDNNAWITILNQNGNLKYENDFNIEVQLDKYNQQILGMKTTKVPLYMIDRSKLDRLSESESLMKNSEVYIFGILKGAQLTPIEITVNNEVNNTNPDNWIIKNEMLYEKIGDPRIKLKEMGKPRLNLKEIDSSDKKSDLVGFSGKILNVQFPERNDLSNVIYSNSLFLDQIKDFQNKLLLDEMDILNTTMQIVDYEQNDIKYNILIKPIENSDGTNAYIFSMTSLQPVDEAVQMIEEYYIYIVAFVSILILLASFYYSIKIARPLLRINSTTKKIANLDFSETIAVHSKDEIGDLSQNINLLSHRLSMYIKQLQQDIEKEKKLENTRKEFISGVSHELKTPLSILQSCITILRGNVASHKKEYYFNAMEKEVDKMDLMIVDMLELAKYESGTYKMKMNVFYINELLEEVCEKLSTEIQQKELRIQTHVFPIKVAANQRRIEQVLTNFLTNAIRYSPSQERIIMVTEKKGEMVKISVENKGAHIEEEHLEKVWDRFYRIDASRQRSRGGTGLGLAISKNILILHGVEYGVCNTDNGVQFYFYLKIEE
ncbi:HAMP domain-containing protein [Viridibacillus sp. YIM B01967]|uniref:histidine kinase n=1 Tax=Viridibacillus soli TaxID=2798301 RepID=A0ABS1H443_9BACL|nr:HAMP domain-containing sensor histidine kinase [Viridibacillus soli]MBK3494173.1 HAMP domain-containing protein [Viridibacillus soli]